MIDPLESLAFSVQANPGVYAVLLGSGVSRSAGVPTGWEVTLDLVRKLAALRKEDCEPDPEAWYADAFGKPPDYSDLLSALAKTPAERQQLLRSYWEPSEDEREEGLKQPTAAHRAIAALAAKGFFRVIITTNFDRLVETALAEECIVPTVLSTPDQVQGALPLIHTGCCVFKVHGDYLDTRIRNTPAELEAYPPEFAELLDRIFDEFGLVVCGWSAEWDTALRNALFRAKSRRFSTYWAVRSEPGEHARKLIAHRGAEIVQIKDADTFFEKLREKVEALTQYSRPHPLSTEAAVASLKRYLPEPRHVIQLNDLVTGVVDDILEETSTERFAAETQVPPNLETFPKRLRAYEAVCATLRAMAPIGGYWAVAEHYPIWQTALQRLGSVSSPAGFEWWIELQRYPAVLLLYGLGIGAVARDRLDFLAMLLKTQLNIRGEPQNTVVEVLPPFTLLDPRVFNQYLPGMKNRHTPLNDRLHEMFKEHTRIPGATGDSFTHIFDKLEILIALSFSWISALDSLWMPPGAFGYRQPNRKKVLQEIEDSIAHHGADSPFVRASLFGGTPEECLEQVFRLEEFVAKLAWW